jgi:hemoglobin
MVCWATGGPQQYTGRSMRDSHVHLNLTEEVWQVFLADLQACLDHFAVSKAEQGEIFALVDSTKSDIVLPAAPPVRRCSSCVLFGFSLTRPS